MHIISAHILFNVSRMVITILLNIKYYFKIIILTTITASTRIVFIPSYTRTRNGTN